MMITGNHTARQIRAALRADQDERLRAEQDAATAVGAALRRAARAAARTEHAERAAGQEIRNATTVLSYPRLAAVLSRASGDRIPRDRIELTLRRLGKLPPPPVADPYGRSHSGPAARTITGLIKQERSERDSRPTAAEQERV